MIQMSNGIQMSNMNNVMCYRNYDMCHVYTVVCCVQNDKYDDACYYHGITFLIQILKAHKLSLSKFEKFTHFRNVNMACPLT